MGRWTRRFLELPAEGHAIWRGIQLTSVDVGVRHDQYLHGGYRYVTKGEMITAQLLDAQGVAFTPDVRIGMRKVHQRFNGRVRYESVIYVPDFIFNRDTYLWTEDDGLEVPIHGIECKASSGIPEKVMLLFERRKIRVAVLGDKEILEYQRRGGFPLQVLRRHR